MKKTIKKIIALSVGATMVGATLLGAMAQYDLGDYPAPFLIEGEFDAYTVVGADADPADILGLGAVTGAMGGEAQTCVAGETETVSVDEGVMVEAPGEDLNYGEDINDIIDEGFDGEDLDLFETLSYKESKGNTNNDVEYDQEMDFTAGTATIVFEPNTEDDNEPVGSYLKIDKNEVLYTYTLDFADEVEYDGGVAADTDEDFEGSYITIQGTKYSIVDADSAGGGNLTDLTLISGTQEATMGEYETETITLDDVEYEVEVIIIADETPSVKFVINGETTDELLEGDTYELEDGTEIGIREIMPNEGSEAVGADQVTFYMGAWKLELESGEEVKINGETNDDYEIISTFTTAVNELAQIDFTVEPNDNIFLGVGEELVDPLFDQWKLVFTGLEKSVETIEFSTTDTQGDITFLNNNGKEVSLPFVADGTGNLTWGDDDDLAQLGFDGAQPTGMAYGDGDLCTGAANADECDDFLFLVTSAGGEVALFEISGIEETLTVCDLKDITNDKTYSDETCAGGIIDTTLGDIRITINGGANRVTFTDIELSGTGEFETSKEGTVTLGSGTAFVTFNLEDDEPLDDQTISLGLDTTNDIEINDTDSVTLHDEEEGSDWQQGIDDGNWGTWFKFDSDGKQDLTIEYPDEQVIADVYVAPTGARTTTTGAEVCSPATIDWVTANKMDTDLASYTAYNLIVVGGPAVNRAAAALLGLTYPTYGAEQDVIPENGAVLKLMPNGEKWALIAAGWEAGNTRQATSVLADHADYATELDGNMEVTIGGEVGSTPVFGYTATVTE